MNTCIVPVLSARVSTRLTDCSVLERCLRRLSDVREITERVLALPAYVDLEHLDIASYTGWPVQILKQSTVNVTTLLEFAGLLLQQIPHLREQNCLFVNPLFPFVTSATLTNALCDVFCNAASAVISGREGAALYTGATYLGRTQLLSDNAFLAVRPGVLSLSTLGGWTLGTTPRVHRLSSIEQVNIVDDDAAALAVAFAGNCEL